MASWAKGYRSRRAGGGGSVALGLLLLLLLFGKGSRRDCTILFTYSVATSRLLIRTRNATMICSGGRAPWTVPFG